MGLQSLFAFFIVIFALIDVSSQFMLLLTLLSIDDFGRRSSNIDRLKLLKPNFIKIEVNMFDRISLVNLINFISAYHPCIIIAEKVENEGLLRLARAAGVKYWQGYLERYLYHLNSHSPVSGTP